MWIVNPGNDEENFRKSYSIRKKLVFQIILDIFHYYIVHRKSISFELYAFENNNFLEKN